MKKSNYLYLLNLFILSVFILSIIATPIMAQGSISGRITYEDANATQQGISGAIVDAIRADDSNQCPTVKGMATTDVNGTYHIYPLEIGNYEVRAYAPGYVSESTIAETCPNNCVTSFDLTLMDANGTVVGKVFQSDGITPIEGATVRAYYPGTENVLASSITSAEGNYTLSNIQGFYDIEASAVGWLSKKLRIEVPPTAPSLDFVLLPGPYYHPDAVFMGWIEIGDLTVVGDYTILLRDLQRRHPVMPPERGLLEVYKRGNMVIQQIVVPGDSFYIDDYIRIKINEINDHENDNYFGRYKLNMTITRVKEPELSVNITTLYRGEIDDSERTLLRRSKEGITTVLLGEVDINATSGSVEFDGNTYLFNVLMANGNIQYVFNFREEDSSFIHPEPLVRGDIVTLGKDNTCKDIRELLLYDMRGDTVVWTPIIHPIMRPQDFDFQTENEIDKPQSDTNFWYVTEIENTGDIPISNVKIRLTAKEFTFLTGNKCYCGSDTEACLEIKSMEPGEKRLIVFKFKAPKTDYLKVSPIQIDLSYQWAYFNEKGEEIIKNYSEKDRTLVTIIPKQPEFQITRNIIKERLLVGETTDVVIRIKNVGDVTATKINLIDYIPQGFELIDGSATMNINKMEKNEVLTLRYTIKALEMGEFDFKTEMLFQDEVGKRYKTTSKIESVRVSKEFPRLEIVKKLDRVTISRGDSVIVALVVRNTGNKIARDIQVLDFVPEGFRLIDDPQTKRIEYTISELKPEQQRMFNYIITASFPGEYKIGDTRLLYYDLEGHSFEHIASGTSVRVTGEPRITASSVQYFNQDYSFLDYKYVDVVLTLTNTGEGLARNISYINSIDGEVELVDGTLSGVIDSLKEGDSETTNYTIRVLQENRDKTFTINTSTEFEDIAGKKTKSDISTNITIGGRTPRINLLRQDSDNKPDIIRIGHIIPVTTIISNTGDGDAKNVIIEDRISSNLQVTTGTNYWSGQLKPDERVTLRYTLTPIQGGEYQIGHTLATYEDEWGVRGTRSLSPSLVTVWGPSISRSLSKNELEEGDILTIRYNIKNWGKDDIYDVKIIENLPQGFEIISGNTEILIGDIKGGNESSKEIEIKATKSGAFVLEDSKLFWKNIYEESKSFDIERTAISVTSKLAPQTTLTHVPESITKVIDDIRTSPYIPYIIFALIVLILSIAGYSIYKSVSSKGKALEKPSDQKVETPSMGPDTSKKETIKPKKRLNMLSKQKGETTGQKIPKTPSQTQSKPLNNDLKKDKGRFRIFSKKEKHIPGTRNDRNSSPSLDAENKFNEFAKRQENQKTFTKQQNDKQLYAKRVELPEKRKKNKFSIFSKKDDKKIQKNKSFLNPKIDENPKRVENGKRDPLLEEKIDKPISYSSSIDQKSIDEKHRKDNSKFKSHIPPINKEENIDTNVPKPRFNSSLESNNESEPITNNDKVKQLDYFEIDSSNSVKSNTEKLTDPKEKISKDTQEYIRKINPEMNLMNKKELDEYQSRILNGLNDLESKKNYDLEGRPLKEIRGKVVPKNLNLDLPPSVEKAYTEYKQSKNNGEPENPFKNEKNGPLKNRNSWTNNFRFNNTSPEIPSSIKELLEKSLDSEVNGKNNSLPNVKETIKGKKEVNSRFSPGSSTSLPDPKDVIKGKKKN